MDKKNKSLSKNQKIVLDFIQKNKKPVKAYSILSNVQKKGINAPPQVYRALDKLIEIGKVHKIESRNSYIACEHKNCDSTTSTSFLICESCDQVSELTQKNLPSYFAKQSEQANFKYAKHNLEIYGTCKDCTK